MRKAVFWIHLVLALGVGVVVGVLALTGVILTFEKQMSAWADPKVAPVADRIPIETLVQKAFDADPALAGATVTLSADPSIPALFTVGRDKRALFDPYTGATLGEGAAGTRGFFRWTMYVHRWFALTPENGRDYGRAVTGACNLVFVLILVTGLFIWWPKRFAWRNFKTVLFMRFDVRGKARDWNWHHALGFWSFIPLLAMALTGMVISYHWAGNVLNYAVGAPANPPPATAPATQGPPKKPDYTPEGLRGLDAMLAAARRHDADWRTMSVKVLSPKDASAAVTVDTGTGAQPQHKTILTLTRDGTVTKAEPFSSLPAARQARLTARFLHTGEILGVFGQFVFGLCSLACVILVWTGFALSWRRFVKRSKTRKTDALPASEPSAASPTSV